MRKQLFLSAIVALVAMLCVAGCSQDEQAPVVEDISAMTKEQVMKEVMPVLQGFLNAQYDYVIGKDGSPQWDQYLSSDATGSDTLKAQIDEMNENRYWYNKSKTIAYSSQISADESSIIVLSGNTWLLQHLVERSTTTEVSEYSLNDPVVSSFVGLPYNFVVVKEGGQWLIQSHEFRGFFPDMPQPRWYAERQDAPYTPYEREPSYW